MSKLDVMKEVMACVEAVRGTEDEVEISLNFFSKDYPRIVFDGRSDTLESSLATWAERCARTAYARACARTALTPVLTAANIDFDFCEEYLLVGGYPYYYFPMDNIEKEVTEAVNTIVAMREKVRGNIVGSQPTEPIIQPPEPEDGFQPTEFPKLTSEEVAKSGGKVIETMKPGSGAALLK